MKVMSMHKTNAHFEAGGMPSREVMEGMGPLIGEMAQAGVFVSGEGLRPSSTGVRLHFSNGKRTITPGPFTGSNELIGGYCLVSVENIEEAIEWSSRYASILGDAEIDIRPLTEFWDLGFGSKPEGLTKTRYMLAHKADARSEAGVLPPPEVFAAIDKLTAEMIDAGVFLGAGGLQPSSKAKRLRFSGGKPTVMDGPFSESKELIGGYSILDVPSLDEAIAWATPFAKLLGDVEIDIRPMFEEKPQ